MAATFRSLFRRPRSENIRQYHRQFSYGPLDQHRQQIRIIHLLPGSFKSPIRIELHVADFSSGQYPEYEALSYTWGKPEPKASLIVGDGDSESYLYVTKNCAEALTYLRLRDSVRVLWIDAICINQSDDVEKSSQVAMMADIYRNASKVTAWIGQASRNSETAMLWIEDVQTAIMLDKSTDTLDGSRAVMNKSQSDAFAVLISKPYWTRLWIWQEMILGSDKAVILWGELEIPWNVFCLCIKYLRNKLIPSRTIVDRLPLLHSLCETLEDTHLMDLLQRTEMCGFSDTRDRIFALGSLTPVEDYAGLDIQPDYRKTWQNLFIDFAISHATGRQNLEFLHHIEKTRTPGILPSWVPDWSQPRTTLSRVPGFAHAGTRAQILNVSKDGLQVRGIRIAEISRVVDSGLILHLGVARDSFPALKLRSLYKTAFPGEASQASMQAFAMALSINLSFETTLGLDHDAVPRQADMEAVMGEHVGLGLSTLPKEKKVQAWSALTRACYGRSLFFTDSDQIGLCPADTRSGDLLCILLGFDAAVVLRPTTTAHAQYQAIGGAHSPGIMNGEALLGPSPAPLEPLTYVSQDESRRTMRHQAFRNRDTGSVQFDDPRLPPLSHPWRRATADEKPYEVRYENIETGELRESWCDPRCDAEELQRRGVDLQSFVLI